MGTHACKTCIRRPCFDAVFIIFTMLNIHFITISPTAAEHCPQTIPLPSHPTTGPEAQLQTNETMDDRCTTSFNSTIPHSTGSFPLLVMNSAKSAAASTPWSSSACGEASPAQAPARPTTARPGNDAPMPSTTRASIFALRSATPESASPPAILALIKSPAPSDSSTHLGVAGVFFGFGFVFLQMPLLESVSMYLLAFVKISLSFRQNGCQDQLTLIDTLKSTLEGTRKCVLFKAIKKGCHGVYFRFCAWVARGMN